MKITNIHPRISNDNRFIGQEPLNIGTYIWLILLVFLWATNAVVVKIAIRDIPPLWAAFLRFTPSVPFVMLFIRWNGSGFQLKKNEIPLVLIAGLMDTVQIFTFNYGSQFTTGGRVTLFIFSYPLMVPLLAPLFIKEEKLIKKNLLGCLIAFSGLLIALRGNLNPQSISTFKGDMIELVSSLIISIKIVYVKRLAVSINKWKILFWSFIIMTILFFFGALLSEELHLDAIRPDAWAAIVFQTLAISVFCFMSWQYLIARHNSSSVSVFFFATPLFGMIIGAVLLGEYFETSLVVACILVGLGIYLVNRDDKKSGVSRMS